MCPAYASANKITITINTFILYDKHKIYYLISIYFYILFCFAFLNVIYVITFNKWF